MIRPVPTADHVVEHHGPTCPALNHVDNSSVDTPCPQRATKCDEQGRRVHPHSATLRLARIRGCEIPDRTAHRVACEYLASESGVREGHYCRHGKAAQQPVGLTGNSVLLGHEQWYSEQRCCKTTRNARITTGRQDHRWSVPDKQVEGSQEGGHKPGHRQQVGRGEATLYSTSRQHGQAEARLGNQARLDAPTATHQMNELRTWHNRPLYKRMSDGQPGQHMTCCPSAGDHDTTPTRSNGNTVRNPASACHEACRAMFRRMPYAAIVTTRALPPKETKGSGSPVMGTTPSTAPMFTNAWTRIQQVTPAASN